MEQWKPVCGYEGLYEVSNLGRVKALPRYNRKHSIILTASKHYKNGRMTVMLIDAEHHSRRILVHRLVAKAFVANPYGYNEINHKDEIPQNNCADNLEWCTRKYNMNYGTTPQRLNIKNKKPVYFIDADGVRHDFDAIRAGKKSGYDGGGICYSLRTGKKYKGVIWHYADKQQK